MIINSIISNSLFGSKANKVDDFIIVSHKVESIYRKALDVVRRNHENLNVKHPTSVTNAELTNEQAMIYCKNAIEMIKSYMDVENELIANLVNEHVDYMNSLIGEIKSKSKVYSYEN